MDLEENCMTASNSNTLKLKGIIIICHFKLLLIFLGSALNKLIP